MNVPIDSPLEPERPIESRLLDVLIRAALVFALVYLCFRVFAPFLTLMVWALILAVAIYPLHRRLARRLGGRQGLAATLIVLLAAVVIVAPTAALMSHFGDSVRGLVHSVQTNTLHVPPPRASVESWPVVGKKLHAAWTQAHTDLPAVVANLQPKMGQLMRSALGMVASMALGVLGFLAAFIIAGIVMAFGEGGARSAEQIFARIVGRERATEFAKLCTATIRAVAQGVIGVALIQAIVIGLTLLVAGVPFAGALALVVLVLGIAQIPALLVTVPAIIYMIILGIGGIADNFLKPLMLGRGVDAPMPVILLGALGGMATAGILGLFVGATLLALGYQIFMHWVSPSATVPDAVADTSAAPRVTPTAGTTVVG
jgi:predicted PurR-regulated permease PerM